MNLDQTLPPPVTSSSAFPIPPPSPNAPAAAAAVSSKNKPPPSPRQTTTFGKAAQKVINLGRLRRNPNTSQATPAELSHQTTQDYPPPRKLAETDLDIVQQQEIHLPRGIKDIINDPKTFSPRPGSCFQTIDIFSTPEHKDCHATPEKRTKEQLQEWLRAEMTSSELWRSWKMKLLFAPQNAKNATAFPLTMTLETYKLLFATMDIPNTILSTIREHNARYMRFHGSKTQGFILHGRNPGVCFITTYDFETKLSYGLVLGLASEDIETVVADIIDKKDDLSCWPPCLVSFCLLDRQSAWVTDSNTRCYMRLADTEKKIFTFSDYFLKRFDPPPDWLNELKTDDIVRELTIITTSIAKSEHNCKVAQSMLRVLEDAYASYLRYLRSHKDNPIHSATFSMDSSQLGLFNPSANEVYGFKWSINKYLRNRAEEIRSAFEVHLYESEFYFRRAEANRQTVYSLVAKQDNSISLQIGMASMMQNATMRSIAQTNTRDSAAMTIISIVTIIFLPGTFVSSLFSTTIFNFNPSQDPSEPTTNSYWHGVYWGITAPVTLFVLLVGVGFFFLRRKHDRKNLDMNQKKQFQYASKSFPPGYIANMEWMWDQNASFDMFDEKKEI